ncbi:hypothetical protein EPA93_01550 [Ktedonosporobacter rubrisoli]|uniref:Uncharacterized protein n=1 Tax=Ktedonosporobacter rubrisoli TaxID=2509675 RepID=A0A4P6JI63_KTERU|nr:hypothetical protein [Ktedonosporobacter rubrisoli]QBD74744.1 hypothetical protein EPA93_01550 [Ktedonosporobacter rubrisoli]
MPFILPPISSCSSYRKFSTCLVCTISLTVEIFGTCVLLFVFLLSLLIWLASNRNGAPITEELDVLPFLSFWLLVIAPLTSLLVGVPAWYLLIELPGKITIRRGSIYGALSSFVAHVVFCTLVALVTVIHQGESLGEGILASASISGIGLLLVGWLVIPIGIYTGEQLIRLRLKQMLASEA